MPMPLLSLIIWLPIGSLVVLLLLPSYRIKIFRYIALGTTLLQGLGVGWVLIQCLASTTQGMTGKLQWIEQCSWMRLDLGSLGSLAIDYLVGIDGLNIGLVLLAVFVLTIGVIASWNIQQYTKAYFALYLLMDTLIMGSFLALDFFLLYVFLEATLVPIYFFIGIWGGPQRTYAATKFFLYTLSGTILILLVLIGLGLSVYDPVATGLQVGIITQGTPPNTEQIQAVQSLVQASSIAPQHIVHSFNLLHMTEVHNFIPGAIFGLLPGKIILGKAVRLLAFLSLAIGFLVKLAAVPFHTWLPDAHVEAPTPISMVLAGIVLKIGGYGLMRTAYSIFPEGAIYYGFWIGMLGVGTVLYAAFNALAMQDLKRMIAYASVAHMGFVLLGLSSLTQEGAHGALYQMVSHGLISALLFLVAGVLQDRTQDRMIDHYSGLATQMPYYTTMGCAELFCCPRLAWIFRLYG